MGSISMTALNPQIEKWKVTLGMLKWGELNIIIIMVKNRDVQIKVMKMDKGEITKPKT
jgi:hypothetical protein